MDGPATGGVRALRTAVVSVVVLALAVLAHVAGGGHLPSGPAAGAAVVAVALVAHGATRRQLTTAALLALLGAGQLVLHHVFMALDAAGPVDATAMPMGAPGHGHAVTLLAVASAGSAGAPGTGVGVGPVVLTPMLASHVVATLLTAAALAGGERALWRLWAWLAPLVVALSVRCSVVAVRLARASAAGEHRPVHEAVLARVLPRRGPPVAAVR